MNTRLSIMSLILEIISLVMAFLVYGWELPVILIIAFWGNNLQIQVAFNELVLGKK